MPPLISVERAAGRFIDSKERLQRHATHDLRAAITARREAETARRSVADMLGPLAQEVRVQRQAVKGIRGAVAQQAEALQAALSQAAHWLGDRLAAHVQPPPEPPVPRRRPGPGMGL